MAVMKVFTVLQMVDFHFMVNDKKLSNSLAVWTKFFQNQKNPNIFFFD